MSSPTEKEWSRFHQIREDLSRLPSSEVPTRIEQLREEGESAGVISMLELQYHRAQPPELRRGRRLAKRYIIKEKIGEGGMGVVYEAMHELTQQEVALKVIHPGLVSSALLKRFQEEIRTLGKLQHDHIVRVFDADYDRSEPPEQDLLFYAMQLVQGLPLTRWVREAHPTVEARLECFIQVCEAVHYAHCHGVVHRDLKPDNILVDEAGRPAILDFGLAQILDLAFEVPKGPLTSDSRTVLEVSGTPAFMSPERWEGHLGGVPADVFALGVLLHELLTGSRPWRVGPDASANELRAAICSFSTEQLKKHPALSRPLVRLLGSMLAADPAARPASAAAVGGALGAILGRRRLKRRVRRAAPVWAGVAVALGSLIGTQIYFAELKRQEQESENRLKEATRIVAQHSQVDTLAEVIRRRPAKLRHSKDQWRDLVLEAMATWNLRDVQGLQLPTGFEPQTGDLQGRRFFGRSPTGSWEMIERAAESWVPTRFPGEHDFLRSRINPQQPQLAALTRVGGLAVWQWKQTQHTNLLASAEADTQFEFSPDGRWLACSATISGSERLAAVRVFSTETWQKMALLHKSSDQPGPGTTFIYVRSRPVAGLAFSPDAKRLAVWSHESSYLLVWEWSKEQLVHFAGHNAPLAAAAWRPAPAEGEIAAIQANGQIRMWKLSPASKPPAYLDVGNSIEWRRAAATFRGQLAWASDGEALAAVDEVNQMMEIFGVYADPASFREPLESSGTRGMRWLSGGLLRPGKSGRDWVPFDSEPPVRRILSIPQFSPSYLAFNPAGTILAAADNTRIVFFATSSGATLAEMQMPLSGPIAFDRISGDFWAYNKTNGPMRWTVSEAQNVLTYMPVPLVAGQSHVGQLAAAGGHLVFSRGTNVFVRTKNASFQPGELLADFAVDALPRELAVSANGQQVAAVWWNPVRAELWRWRSSGGWVAEPSSINTVVLANLTAWNRGAPMTIGPAQQRTAGEKAVKSKSTHFGSPRLLIPAAQVPMVAWLPESEDGIHLDYLGRESCIHIGTLPFEREQGFPALVLSPDGTRLARASSKGEIHVWDLHLMLEKLSHLDLGIDEIHLEKVGQTEQFPTSLTIAGPD